MRFRVHHVLITGVLLSGLLRIVMGTLSNVWLYFVIVLGMGIILAPVNVAISGWMTELADPKYMGRVSGWIDPLMMGAHSLSLGIIAVVFPTFVNVETIYYVIGILLISVGLYYLFILLGLVRGFAKITVKNELPLPNKKGLKTSSSLTRFC